jgi:hypothetical protein
VKVLCVRRVSPCVHARTRSYAYAHAQAHTQSRSHSHSRCPADRGLPFRLDLAGTHSHPQLQWRRGPRVVPALSARPAIRGRLLLSPRSRCVRGSGAVSVGVAHSHRSQACVAAIPRSSAEDRRVPRCVCVCGGGGYVGQLRCCVGVAYLSMYLIARDAGAMHRFSLPPQRLRLVAFCCVRCKDGAAQA